MKKKISYTVWGTEKSSNTWIEWYNEVKDIFLSLNYGLTHIGITSKACNSGKISTAKRKEKEFIERIQEGEKIDCVECYSLLPDYKTAMFDYRVLCARCSSYITFVINDEDLTPIVEKHIIEFEKKYFNISEGEVYSTSIKELPVLYAETKDSNNLDSYKSIKKIT